ncbi:hypothetical protein NQZ68_010537 [Dissostichus eleginoides]|nr:hypothetical protein NQZ68_010537 [Dissostichus eleginoides]
MPQPTRNTVEKNIKRQCEPLSVGPPVEPRLGVAAALGSQWEGLKRLLGASVTETVDGTDSLTIHTAPFRTDLQPDGRNTIHTQRNFPLSSNNSHRGDKTTACLPAVKGNQNNNLAPSSSGLDPHKDATPVQTPLDAPNSRCQHVQARERKALPVDE